MLSLFPIDKKKLKFGEMVPERAEPGYLCPPEGCHVTGQAHAEDFHGVFCLQAGSLQPNP